MLIKALCLTFPTGYAHAWVCLSKSERLALLPAAALGWLATTLTMTRLLNSQPKKGLPLSIYAATARGQVVLLLANCRHVYAQFYMHNYMHMFI